MFDLAPFRTLFRQVPDAYPHWVLVCGDGLDRPVLVRLAHVEGRLACTGLLIGFDLERVGRSRVEVVGEPERELLARELRVPLGAVMRSIEEHPVFLNIVGDARKVARPPRRRPGPKGHPRPWYGEFAEQWRDARARWGRSAAMTLANDLKYSRQQIYRFRDRAFDLGYLTEEDL
jgi:hypothetical protein